MKTVLRVALLSLICFSLALNHATSTLASSDQNSILNLYDAFGYQKKGTVLDWGFSALVHYNGKTILFDTGNSATSFEHNVKALGVDLSKVDIAILSPPRGSHFGLRLHVADQAGGQGVFAGRFCARLTGSYDSFAR